MSSSCSILRSPTLINRAGMSLISFTVCWGSLDSLRASILLRKLLSQNKREKLHRKSKETVLWLSLRNDGIWLSTLPLEVSGRLIWFCPLVTWSMDLRPCQVLKWSHLKVEKRLIHMNKYFSRLGKEGCWQCRWETLWSPFHLDLQWFSLEVCHGPCT